MNQSKIKTKQSKTQTVSLLASEFITKLQEKGIFDVEVRIEIDANRSMCFSGNNHIKKSTQLQDALTDFLGLSDKVGTHIFEQYRLADGKDCLTQIDSEFVDDLIEVIDDNK